MIDLIIPVYNNYQGLLRTLASINLDIFAITVVDDCSKEPINTDFPINYIRLKKNVGPGWARQIGIDDTKNEYISFIDAGDVFLSKEIQQTMKDMTISYPDQDIFWWPFLKEGHISSDLDNHMHGRVYKREFLNKYKIAFCKEGSYANEDIGFNRACRIIATQTNSKIYYPTEPVIDYITDETSLTALNNREFTYKVQNRGLSINSSNAIEIIKANSLDPTAEIHYIAVALYYWFVVTAAERPEFIQEAWSGAKIFYDKYKNEIKLNELVGGNGYMRKCVELRKKVPFQINVLRFANDIWRFEKIPDKYLT